ncbi:MAG: AAA family ATPase [Bacteroidales bacterium]|nr:AAA family ATPase [Bacteroidales bacterium]
MEQEEPTLDRFPLGIQSFEKLRKCNAAYIDKTDYIFRLVHSSTTSYFLARPRRFGKSLLCNTLRAYFEGKKELFEGLKISQWEQEWTTYPILYLDFVSGDYTKKGTLENTLIDALATFEKANGIIADENKSIAKRFEADLKAVYEKTGKGTAIIVDEYDNPLIHSTDLEADKATYRGFFTVLKSSDRYIRFAFLTGVTKLAKTSVFTGDNQPEDISIDRSNAAICGVTKSELTQYFTPEIEQMAQSEGITFEQCIDALKQWYDGYRFHELGESVLNPVSLFNALKKKDFKNYWYGTGTPTILMQRIRKTSFDYRILDNDVKYLKNSLENYKDTDFKTELIPLLYYSGYLTIKSFEKEDLVVEYTLGFPNNEVKISFLTNLIDEFYHSDTQSGFEYLDFARDFRKGNIESAMKRFKALFCTLPYANDKNVTLIERDFQNVIFLVFSILGFNAISEPHFSQGRADVVLINKNFVYIFEFKVDQDAQTALNQINLKNYTGRYDMSGRKIFKIGANFSSSEKNLTEWMVEEVGNHAK